MTPLPAALLQIGAAPLLFQGKIIFLQIYVITYVITMSTDNNTPTPKSSRASRSSRISRLIVKLRHFYEYVTEGVWSDMRRSRWVTFTKTVNLSVRSFLNADLQLRAAALTYQTILALVPALALVFAICRGFGFQNLIQTQLFNSFPAQQQALATCLKFVDSYLAQSSEGIFVGIGIVFLLWTLISMMSNVEDSFNTIWGGIPGRTFWRKCTDYTAIFLLLPVLMICSSGITVFMSTTIQNSVQWEFLSTGIMRLLDLSSVVLVWFFFAGTYMLIPNTRVKFKNAFPAGVLAGTGFLILQWLFVSGQIYVTRYNAIYGSFSFLPLLLIWIQLVWLITLSGAVFCYSSQNILAYSFNSEIEHISEEYRWRILLAVMTVTVQRFQHGQPPADDQKIASAYGLPISLVSKSVKDLIKARLLMRVVTKPGNDRYQLAPAVPCESFTLGDFMRRTLRTGNSGFIPDFTRRFVKLDDAVGSVAEVTLKAADKIRIADLAISDIKNPDMK